MAIMLIVFLILLVIGLLYLSYTLLKWTSAKKIRAKIVLFIVSVFLVGIGINHFFFKNMRFIQSEVYSNLFLVKYIDKDYSVVEKVIKNKIREHLKIEHKMGKKLSYTGESAIYFYEYGGSTLGFIGEAGTSYFIEHEEDWGGFVTEELGMYQDYRLAEFYYDLCTQDSTLYCGEINYFKHGEFFKVDSLKNIVSAGAHKKSQDLK